MFDFRAEVGRAAQQVVVSSAVGAGREEGLPFLVQIQVLLGRVPMVRVLVQGPLGGVDLVEQLTEL